MVFAFGKSTGPDAETGAFHLKPGSIGFGVLLGAISALPPLSIDLNLPALPQLARALAVAPQSAAATLSAFLFGFAVAQLIYGPASDRYGRRPLLLIGLVLYVAGGLACAFASSLPTLLVWRALQGAGAGAGMVLSRAIVRDSFPDPASARVQFAYVNAVSQVAPVIAPPLGALMLMAGLSWRAIFLCLAGAGAVLICVIWMSLRESLTLDPNASGQRRGVAHDYLRFVRSRVSIANTLLTGCTFGGLFTFVSGSSLVFVNTLHLSALNYAGIFALISACIIAGSWATATLSRGRSAEGLLKAHLVTACLGSVAILIVQYLSGTGGMIVPLTLGFSIVAYCAGATLPISIQQALQSLPEIAGTGAALLGCVQMLGGSLAAALVGPLFHSLGPVGIPWEMLAFCVGAVILNGRARAVQA
ncbi:multidrug effflux MFS transporter [Pararobbsia alpina]|uniref:Bcr/CflA family efflux transporter n=1 Tax=Pararobbsia alpina TaxID=621374 RepID=A0A6S7BQV7_9BURK|nr:multidrug effflux MFS transporter [Pararobbsia alpina]CAB3792401.1 Bicyclomycin resistance protein [Pararobbsia alpina]